MTAHRPSVGGRNRVVTSAHQLATQAGMRMLWAGGNAVGAAVAVAAALSVVEPCSSGAAGVGYMLIGTPREKAPAVLDFVGPAPGAAHPERFRTPGSKDVGILAALDPGAAGGWAAVLERYGSMDLATVLAPAISCAEQGFPVSRTDGSHAPVSCWSSRTPPVPCGSLLKSAPKRCTKDLSPRRSSSTAPATAGCSRRRISRISRLVGRRQSPGAIVG